MRMTRALVLGVVAAGMVTATALPASAATDTTFSLTGGALSVTAPTTAALTDATSGTTTISGPLGPMSVTDARGGTAGWTVSAISTPFTGALASPSVSTAVSYTGGAATTTGTVTVADGAATTLTGTAASVMAGSGVSGNNTAAWAPTLSVTMPASAKADTYAGTVTTSIA